MEETKVNGRKSRKEARKKRNMRNTVIMAALSVALLGGATYAWFTLSSTAKITNLSLGVTESSGLMIADAVESNAQNAIGGTVADEYMNTLELDMNNSNATLSPATLIDTVIKAPVYTDNTVTSLTTAGAYLVDADVKNGETAVKEGYYYETEFYLKVEAEGTYEISLVKPVSENGKFTEGTYVVSSADGTLVADPAIGAEASVAKEAMAAAAATRIAFYTVADNGQETLAKIYEPNSDIANTSGLAADVAQNVISSYTDYTTLQQEADGDFVGSDTSLFTIEGNKDNKIVMRVWLEGKDSQCTNDISIKDIIGSIKFDSSKVTP